MAVHDLVLLEIALQVGSDEIPTPHAHAGCAGYGGEGPQGRGPHRGAEGLVVIHAMNLSASLYAQTSFESAAAL
eukprot:2112628-Pleurochrysis_carterae.AAC.1